MLSLPVSSVFAQAGLDTLSLKSIFSEPYLPGVRPSFSGFTADAEGIFFFWNDSSYHETGLYRVDLSGENLEKADEESIFHSFVPSPDGSQIAYVDSGSIRISDPKFISSNTLITSLSPLSNLQWSPDGSRIAYMLDDEIWYIHLEDRSHVQVTEQDDEEPPYRLMSWAGTRKLLLSKTDDSESKRIYFPEFIDEFVEPGGSVRGIPSITYSIASLDSLRPVVEPLYEGRNRSIVRASDSGKYIVADYADPALKVREIRVYDTDQNTMELVFEDSTRGWLHHRDLRLNPSGEEILFLSERDGWNHIYTVRPDGSGLQQHTRGLFEISWVRWLTENRIVYASNEVDYGVRHLYIMDLDDGRTRRLTGEDAYRYQFELSSDRRFVVYAKTLFNRPYDLFQLDLENMGREVQLTRSVPGRFREIGWQEEKYVRISGRDGETELSMSVLFPAGFDPENLYPVVVFAHGAGSLQNVYKGWSNNYYREYMFHQFLTQKGYLVVEVDFRHSTGYGRKFREDVAGWMGKYETEDILDGLDWLRENVGGVDPDRVGIYGGSYGGFMALYAVSSEPERFHAAAALRAVTNWKNYYHANPWYTEPRLGRPEENPDSYERSSPLTYAGEMEHPVLILHGLTDDNVGFQDAAQYLEELIQSGHEEFETMIYPSESHGFVRPESWYDEYRRIFEFFERYVRQRNQE